MNLQYKIFLKYFHSNKMLGTLMKIQMHSLVVYLQPKCSLVQWSELLPSMDL